VNPTRMPRFPPPRPPTDDRVPRKTPISRAWAFALPHDLRDRREHDAREAEWLKALADGLEKGVELTREEKELALVFAQRFWWARGRL
jgi:hypothetical protein